MKEGAWINAATGKFVWINEHGEFARSKAGQQQLGLSPTTCAKIDAIPRVPFKNGPEREEILILVMKEGWIRFRGHGASMTCEFYGDTYTNLWACFKFLQEMCGPASWCVINNLKTGETIQMPFQQLSNGMREDETKVMRVAKKMFAAREGLTDLTDPKHLDAEERKAITAAYVTHHFKTFKAASTRESVIMNGLVERGYMMRVAGGYRLDALGTLVATALAYGG